MNVLMLRIRRNPLDRVRKSNTLTYPRFYIKIKYLQNNFAYVAKKSAPFFLGAVFLIEKTKFSVKTICSFFTHVPISTRCFIISIKLAVPSRVCNRIYWSSWSAGHQYPSVTAVDKPFGNLCSGHDLLSASQNCSFAPTTSFTHNIILEISLIPLTMSYLPHFLVSRVLEGIP